MISARQMANLYLARVADEVIHNLVAGEEQVKLGIVGNMQKYRNAAARIAYSAPIIARTFWEDMGLERPRVKNPLYRRSNPRKVKAA